MNRNDPWLWKKFWKNNSQGSFLLCFAGAEKQRPESRPNIFSIPKLRWDVNNNLCILHKFSVLDKMVLFVLYNIPSCKIQGAVVLYRYKDSSSQEETRWSLSIIFRLNKYVVSTKWIYRRSSNFVTGKDHLTQQKAR